MAEFRLKKAPNVHLLIFDTDFPSPWRDWECRRKGLSSSSSKICPAAGRHLEKVPLRFSEVMGPSNYPCFNRISIVSHPALGVSPLKAAFCQTSFEASLLAMLCLDFSEVAWVTHGDWGSRAMRISTSVSHPLHPWRWGAPLEPVRWSLQENPGSIGIAVPGAQVVNFFYVKNPWNISNKNSVLEFGDKTVMVSVRNWQHLCTCVPQHVQKTMRLQHFFEFMAQFLTTHEDDPSPNCALWISASQ